MYTKGDWRVSCRKNLYGDEYSAVNSGDEMIAVISGFGHKANAQLIALSPKMAGLLKELADWDGGKFGKESNIKLIEISKSASKIIAELEGR